MKKWTFLFMIVFLLSNQIPAFAADGTENDLQEAKNVIAQWITALKKNDYQKISALLAPQFVSIHRDGFARNKERELALLKELKNHYVRLSHFKFSQTEHAVVATYHDEGRSGSSQSRTSDRMMLLQKIDDRWQIVAYANFDPIITYEAPN